MVGFEYAVFQTNSLSKRLFLFARSSSINADLVLQMFCIPVHVYIPGKNSPPTSLHSKGILMQVNSLCKFDTNMDKEQNSWEKSPFDMFLGHISNISAVMVTRN
jgi:hypothetical protein